MKECVYLLGDETYTDLDLHLTGFNLPEAAKVDLLCRFQTSLSKSKHQLAKSFRKALASQFKTIYYRMRQEMTGVPFGKIPETESMEVKFEEAASWCFESRISPEKLIACAIETMTSTRFPTSHQLTADFLRERVIFWIPKEERRRNRPDGFVHAANVPIEEREAIDYDILLYKTSDFPGLFKNETTEG
jgi:hypothetical protein